jgi:hypothetical protein
MKRLLCFFDGTWNHSDDEHQLTNVVKLCRVVPEVARDGVRQVVRYIVGIATDKSLGDLTFAAGAAGYGVTERILYGYKQLIESYEPGDEIYIFGFSRGAFQARSLGGLMAHIGVLRGDAVPLIEDAWSNYRQHSLMPDVRRLAQLRALSHWPVRIRLIGVWDTVGNLGIPFAPDTFISRALSFHSTTLSPHVEVGLHALAIDEPRGSFSPTFWTRRAGEAPAVSQVIEQVWFPGCHANVGGGYRDCALSDGPLRWMAERVTALTPLELDLARLRRDTAPEALGEAVLPTSDAIFRVSNLLPYVRLIRQDRSGLSPLRRRVLGRWRTSAIPTGEEIVNEAIHESAIARFGQRVPLRYGDAVSSQVYAPRPLARALSRITP